MRENKKPIITISLAVINVAVFVLLEIFGDTSAAEYMTKMGAVWPAYVQQGQYWRLITATFMHFSFDHILNNMLVLMCAGTILEHAMGHVKFLILYLFAGLGGSVLSYLQMIYSGKYAVSAGASGAIFGIIGGLLWVVVRNKGRYEKLSSKGLIFMIAISLYYGFRDRTIDNWGHIGGFIMGFVLGIILYRKMPKPVDFEHENPYTNE